MTTNSILSTIKKLCHIDETDDAFDLDITIHINTAIFELEQIGCPPFIVTSATQTWTDYLGTSKNLEAVKTCIYLKVKLVFDPPTNSFLVDSTNRMIDQYMWRIRNNIEQEVQTSGGSTGTINQNEG